MKKFIFERSEHRFNPNEDLYKGALKLFKENRLDLILEETELINIYLEYRSITDVNILKNKLEEAIGWHQKATQELAPFLQSFTQPQIYEEPSDMENQIFFMKMISQTKAFVTIEIITHLIKANANRKDIILSDDFWPIQEETSELEVA